MNEQTTMTAPMRITIDFTGGIKQVLPLIQMYEQLYPEQYHAKGGTAQAVYSACPVAMPVVISCGQELPRHLQTLHLMTHGHVDVDHQTTKDFHALKALGFPVELTEPEHEQVEMTGKHKKARKLVAKTMAELFDGNKQGWFDVITEAAGIVDGVPAYMPARAE